MTNGNEKPAQTHGWQSGIWSNSAVGTVGSFPKPRGPLGSSRDSNDTFQGTPSGLGALTANSEAEPSYKPNWRTPGRETTQPRNGSGTTSPNRPRTDAPALDISNNSSFYSGPQQAIGQRATVRPKPAPAVDSTKAAFKYPAFSDFADETENVGAFGSRRLEADQRRNDFGGSKRLSQDLQFPHITNQASHDTSMPTTSHSDTDLHSHASTFGDHLFGGYALNSSLNNPHSQRPSISGQSSFGTQNSRGYGNGVGQQMDEDELEEQIANMTLGGLPNGTSNGPPGLGNFGPPSQPFQFNPGSQPWENGGYGQQIPRDMYANSLYDRRPSAIGRASPAGSAYRSPGSFSGTPQPVPDAWNSRPTSRDHRIPLDSDRRNVNQQQFVLQHAAPPYQTNPYFNSNNPHFPFQYDNYGANYRQGMPGYNYPVNQYPVPPGMPTRPTRDQDPLKDARSHLLEEFRSSTRANKRWELKDIYNHVVEFAGDQHGSRFIQGKLESANSDEKDQVFKEILPNVVQLQKDVFGNYVIQKMYEHGNQLQKEAMAARMKGQVVSLSTQMYACRVVQKALEHVLVEQQAELAKELESDVLRIMKDQNGNHVIQKIIERVPREHIGFVMECFKGRASELASHAYGCRVIQRVLEYGTKADKRMILDELHACAQVLVTDQYGNYVTQHVIERGPVEDQTRMITMVIGQLLTLCRHKFASNVVEKCIDNGTAEQRRQITEMLSLNPTLMEMMKDQYGNYVIQKLLRTLKDEEKAKFATLVKPHLDILKTTSFATMKHVVLLDEAINGNGKAKPKSGAKTPTSTAPASAASGSPAPTSPELQIHVASTVPTPNLTTEPNSPSSNPPSTNASSVGETEQHADGKLAGTDMNGVPDAPLLPDVDL
ncbi:pumilio domain-containing protein [Apodospora peruviana]|uniref:Pumilio homology domain family member 3 n=1 Tax=Apodospora peruviana TaxID=516989 RepID=A0AAE0HVV0_9PEZI|nr:pumilio domain-containing protein [Apodospora peruviana]